MCIRDRKYSEATSTTPRCKKNYSFTPETSENSQNTAKHFVIQTLWMHNGPLVAQDEGELWVILKDTTSKALLEERANLNSAKSVLLSIISHELRTPLNGLIGALYVMSEQVQDGIKGWWQTAYSSALLLLNTVNCLLDFSSIEMSAFVITNSDLNIRSLINELRGLFIDVLPKDKVILNHLVSEEVPLFFRTDAKRVRQILINLLSNAINYTYDGSITLHVAMEANNNMKISVQDTGIGISKEAQASLFNFFNCAKKVLSGQDNKLPGLGLVISCRIISKLGGAVAINSVPNVGTTFTFTLPRVIGADYRAPSIELAADKIEGDAKDGLRNRLKESFSFSLKRSTSTKMDFNANRRFKEIHESELVKLRKMESAKHCDNEFKDKEKKDIPDLSCDSENSICDELKPEVTPSSIASVNRTLRKTRLNFGVGASNKRLRTGTSVRRVQSDKVQILIVDDTAINRLVLNGMLKTLGYRAKEACNGKEACKIIKEHTREEGKFDMVLMDVQMPVMDGMEATCKIRKRHSAKELPIVGVTSLTSEAELQKCITVGMNAVMTKPLSLSDLKKIMRDYDL
eukprot:TRINITY_DN3533_c0_g2_i3.p1 TRINITY_DN3533_c0_g2~~TRINITY_DN3533_c0_g2_i3.p1  ORF type:complete len:574 (-),score=107.32 TRINITY_DN3533_c0_g2_i3:172-1893(-)